MRILNLYAGIGGNRKLWEGHEVTAVELSEDIAAVYKMNFPEDHMIVGDAHQYLLDHYSDFDFIWSSPPCQSHSRTNYFLNPIGVVRFPDMSLYQEIIFLQSFFKGLFCVENVIGYYDPLIKPKEIRRQIKSHSQKGML
jgi:DNA (cytosine-5)-methyltransferase 1